MRHSNYKSVHFWMTCFQSIINLSLMLTEDWFELYFGSYFYDSYDLPGGVYTSRVAGRRFDSWPNPTSDLLSSLLADKWNTPYGYLLKYILEWMNWSSNWVELVTWNGYSVRLFPTWITFFRIDNFIKLPTLHFIEPSDKIYIYFINAIIQGVFRRLIWNMKYKKYLKFFKILFLKLCGKSCLSTGEVSFESFPAPMKVAYFG